MQELMNGSNAEGNLKIKNALLSVFDKTNLIEFASRLNTFGVSLIATGGTVAVLEKSGLSSTPADKVGHFPEMLDGRVKTLQPEIFAGLLAQKSDPEHMRQIAEKGIRPIDMVVCNFYDFEKVAQRSGTSDSELIEMIDIGGPSIVRAAAKNFDSVCIISSPKYYSEIERELDALDGSISLTTRRKMAAVAFEIVAKYDVSIYNSLHSRFNPREFPESLFISARQLESPKYGENPDQEAMIYSIEGFSGGIPSWNQIFGDIRSYNNNLDIGGAFEILAGFEDHPTAATVKHGQISGFAFSNTLADAYKLAHSCDPEADFGNTTVLNRTVDVETAKMIGKNEGKDDGSVYTEILLAPGYETQALDILKQKQKKKIRILETSASSSYPYDVKVLEGLVLVQKAPSYLVKLSESQLTVETSVKPKTEDIPILLGLWEIARKVQSNAIVIGNGSLAKDGSLEKLWTLGIGSFRKRNGATRIALDNAGSRAKGAFCASDGFFPFSDSVELLGLAGIKGIIQPGGSQSDKRILETSDRFSIPMLFTHKRAFKH